MYRVWGSGFRGLGCGVLERTYKRVYKGSGFSLGFIVFLIFYTGPTGVLQQLY